MLTKLTHIVLQFLPKRLNNLLKKQDCVLFYCNSLEVNQIPPPFHFATIGNTPKARLRGYIRLLQTLLNIRYIATHIANLMYWLSSALSNCIKQNTDIWLLGKNHFIGFSSRY